MTATRARAGAGAPSKPPAPTPAPEPTEAQMARAIIHAARILDYRIAHFRPGRTAHGWRTPVQGDGAGFPDLVLVGHGRIWHRELKMRHGRLDAEQKAWGDAIVAAGGDWAVVKGRAGLTALLDEMAEHATASRATVVGNRYQLMRAVRAASERRRGMTT